MNLPPEPIPAFRERLLGLADDELVLAQRDAEWTGHAPILEEDIALANLAQDELGHATLLYGRVEALGGGDPDRQVYFRDPADWRNLRLVELPRGDWAVTLLRQYLFDTWESVLYPALATSADDALAAIAQKILREERFHLRHSALWVERLGLGTDESRRRIGAALERLWPHVPQLFAPEPGDAALVEADLFPDVATLRAPWREAVEAHLRASGLEVPRWPGGDPEPRTVHSEHLEPLLAELQRIARADPEAVW